MNPAMFIFVNDDLNMSAGKVAAQASHAAVEAYRLSDVDLIKAWYVGKHYAKYIMRARDGFHLFTIKSYLGARGFRSELIIDEGHTEVDPISATALGVEIVDKDDPHVVATFESFELLRSPRPSDIAAWKRRAEAQPRYNNEASKRFDRLFGGGKG